MGRDPSPDPVNLIPAPPVPRVSGSEAGEEVVAFQGPVSRKSRAPVESWGVWGRSRDLPV